MSFRRKLRGKLLLWSAVLAAALLDVTRAQTDNNVITAVNPTTAKAAAGQAITLTGDVGADDLLAWSLDCEGATLDVDPEDGTDIENTFDLSTLEPGDYMLCYRSSGQSDSVAQVGITLTVKPGDPNRVFIWIVGVLPFVYLFLVALLTGVYKALRGGNLKGYEELKAKGEVLLEDAEELPESNQFWAMKSMDQVRIEHGLDAVFYLMHNKQMSIFCLIQFFAVGIPLLCTYGFGGDKEKDSLSMYSFSYANLSPDNGLRWIPVFASYVMVGTIIGLVTVKQKSMAGYKAADSDASSPNAVWVQGLPRSTTDSDLSDWLGSTYPDTVEDSRVVWDVNALGHNIRKRRKLIKKINSEQVKIAEEAADGDGTTSLNKLQPLVAEVEALEKEEKPLRTQPTTCAGSAFVTFKSVEAAEKFRDDIKGKSVSNPKLATSGWVTEKAPKPIEIYWENFGLESGAKINAFFKSMIFTLGIFFLFILLALGCVVCVGYLYMELIYKVMPVDAVAEILRPMQDATGPFVWYGIISLIFVGLFLFLEEEMAPIVKFISKYEMPLTKSHKQSSFLGKCYFFYLIYHLVLSTALLGVLALTVKIDDDFNGGALKLYVESIGMFHQNRCFLTACVIDMFHVFEGLAFVARPAHTLTMEEEAKFNSAEDEDENEDAHDEDADKYFCDKFSYSRNYGESIGVFTSICYYQTMHPTILACGAFYYIVKMYVDKYQITSQYSRPHIQYGRRARTTTTYILTAFTCGQLGNAIYFLILTDGMADVGIAMTGSFLLSVGVLSAYIYQPSFLKKDKSAESSASRTSSASLTPAGTYNPPKPDDLQVGVTIETMGSNDIVKNPMDTNDDEADNSME